jgi:hypothetical protein
MEVNGLPTAQEEASLTEIMVDLNLDLVIINSQPGVLANRPNANLV